MTDPPRDRSASPVRGRRPPSARYLLDRARRRMRPAGEHHPKALAWRVMQLLVAGSRSHAFLDRAWIPWLLRLAPGRLRRRLALSLLSLSPHYWVYQWTNYYPPGMRRREVLDREFRRNAESREQLGERLLARFLGPEMAVLDFGCGPGFLARAVSPRVARVLAADVSRGVIACAEQINGAPNVRYVTNPRGDLRIVADESLDLVYSFAVFQHLLKEQAAAFFAEFRRILRPGGQAVIHALLKEPGEARMPDDSAGGWIRSRVNLRMVYFTAGEFRSMVELAGFRHVEVVRVAELTDIRDDIGREHLVLCRR